MNAPLIIGGGPAGASAAILLAKGGARPLIVERAAETGDAICGGFLSWRTLARLETLGVTADALGGHPVDTLRLFAGKHMAQAPLPGGAMGVSRHRLDTLLIERAVAAGAAHGQPAHQRAHHRHRLEGPLQHGEPDQRRADRKSVV